MRKALRVIAISAGITSAVSTIILGSIYLEDVLGYIKSTKTKLANKVMDKKTIGDTNVNE